MRTSRNVDDASFERLIRGAAPSTESEDEALALFVQRARRIAEAPVDPSVEQLHLSAILEEAHLLVEKGDPVGRPVSNAAGPVFGFSVLPKRRRRFVLSSLFASLASKLAASGVALALVTTGGLAANGNLPDGLQDTISQAADKVGVDIPEGDDEEDVDSDLDDELVSNADAGKRSNFDVHEAQASNTGTARGEAVSEAARRKPAGDVQNGSSTSQAVHDAIESTDPGRGRGEAVSEAASQKGHGGGSGDGDEESEITDTPGATQGPGHGQGQSKKNQP